MSINVSSDVLYQNVLNQNSYTRTYRKKVRVQNENIQGIQDEIEEVRKNIKKLRNYSSSTISKDKLEKNLEEFVKTYNEFKGKSNSIEDNKDINKELGKLEEFLKENKKQLKKIGIKVKDDGKLEFDSEKYDDVKQKDIDALLEGNDCFANNIYKMMRNIDRMADDSEYTLEYKMFSEIVKDSNDEASTIDVQI